MSGGRLVFPDPRGIVVRCADDRLVVLPARAAAGSRGRRGSPRLLPELPGRPVAVGFDGRWLLVTCWREGEMLRLRIPPKSDAYGTASLGEAAEPESDVLTALPAVGIEWPDSRSGATTTTELRLGGSEPLVAAEHATGKWTVRSKRGECDLALPSGSRVVSPARLERELGLATLRERELSFIGSAGSRRSTTLRLEGEETAPCQAAPWLAVLAGNEVELRELGRTWARRLGHWTLGHSR